MGTGGHQRLTIGSAAMSADGGLTLGEAAAAWKRQRDRAEGEPDTPRPLAEPPQPADAGPVAPDGGDGVSPSGLPGDGR